MAHFPCDKIAYEGSSSKNPLAFKHYNPEEIVGDKTMKEHLRFAAPYWHVMRNVLADPFGGGTAQMPWDDGSDSVENALARVRGLKNVSRDSLQSFENLLEKVRIHISQWQVEDELQTRKIQQLKQELETLFQEFEKRRAQNPEYLWEQLLTFAQSRFSLEGQELTVSMMIEPHGDLVDELADPIIFLKKGRIIFAGGIPA